MDNKSSKVTNWGIVKSGMQAIHLLKVLNEPSSLNKTMGQLLNETYTDYTDLRILNKGVLMMAAYLQFVYLDETVFNKIPFNEYDFSDFIIEFSSDEINNNYIAKKLRNSISHGRFKFIENDLLYIEDCNFSTEEINFKATIQIVKFGKFIDDFAFKNLDNNIK